MKDEMFYSPFADRARGTSFAMPHVRVHYSMAIMVDITTHEMLLSLERINRRWSPIGSTSRTAPVDEGRLTFESRNRV